MSTSSARQGRSSITSLVQSTIGFGFLDIETEPEPIQSAIERESSESPSVQVTMEPRATKLHFNSKSGAGSVSSAKVAEQEPMAKPNRSNSAGVACLMKSNGADGRQMSLTETPPDGSLLSPEG